VNAEKTAHPRRSAGRLHRHFHIDLDCHVEGGRAAMPLRRRGSTTWHGQDIHRAARPDPADPRAEQQGWRGGAGRGSSPRLRLRSCDDKAAQFTVISRRSRRRPRRRSPSWSGLQTPRQRASARGIPRGGCDPSKLSRVVSRTSRSDGSRSIRPRRRRSWAIPRPGAPGRPDWIECEP